MAKRTQFDLKDQNISKTFQHVIQVQTGSAFHLDGTEVNEFNVSGSMAVVNSPDTGVQPYIQIDNIEDIDDITVRDGKLHSRDGTLFWGDTALGAPGDSSGITSLEVDPSPELGADLDLSEQNIGGIGNIDITGNIKGTKLIGTGVFPLTRVGDDSGTPGTNALLEIFQTDRTQDILLIKSGSFRAATLNKDGALLLGGFAEAPNVEEGGFYYNSNDKAFFLGLK